MTCIAWYLNILDEVLIAFHPRQIADNFFWWWWLNNSWYLLQPFHSCFDHLCNNRAIKLVGSCWNLVYCIIEIHYNAVVVLSSSIVVESKGAVYLSPFRAFDFRRHPARPHRAWNRWCRGGYSRFFLLPAEFLSTQPHQAVASVADLEIISNPDYHQWESGEF